MTHMQLRESGSGCHFPAGQAVHLPAAVMYLPCGGQNGPVNKSGVQLTVARLGGTYHVAFSVGALQHQR
jgi:hypothetical protein